MRSVSTGPFIASITGLTAGATYYARAYATNAVGTSYGSVITFTTLNAPTVSTQAVTSITGTTATGNGTITNLGIPASVTDYGVCWSSSNATPTTADSKAGNGATLAHRDLYVHHYRLNGRRHLLCAGLCHQQHRHIIRECGNFYDIECPDGDHPGGHVYHRHHRYGQRHNNQFRYSGIGNRLRRMLEQQ